MKPTTNIPRRPQYRGGRSSSVQDLSEAAQAIASILYRCLSTKLVGVQTTLWIIAAGFKEKPYKVGVGFLNVGVHLDNVIDVNSVSDTDLCDCDVKNRCGWRSPKWKIACSYLDSESDRLSRLRLTDMTPWCILHGGWLARSASLLIPMNKAVMCQVMIS